MFRTRVADRDTAPPCRMTVNGSRGRADVVGPVPGVLENLALPEPQSVPLG